MTLSYKGGLKNTIVQLVELDLDCLDYIQHKIDPVKDKMNSFFQELIICILSHQLKILEMTDVKSTLNCISLHGHTALLVKQLDFM